MDIFRALVKELKTWADNYRQVRAQRDSLRLIMARKDEHLLRDVGLTLHEAESIGPPRGGKGRSDTGRDRRD
ncbi:hypothetical protein [Shinella sp.]|uniref:hypothetical protein n=1 Tax=Shinella sp. TaxID=1870904 RepID=UPI0029BB58D3|nr:hypothetical protein [Shinella sp.]MDX3977595.1 hypothetical protein [Shinella sp.]